MTDIPTEPTIVANIYYKYQSGRMPVLSVDLTEYGALILTLDGEVRLLPWHTVTDITFLDDSAFQPQVLVTGVDDAALPARHEGSE